MRKHHHSQLAHSHTETHDRVDAEPAHELYCYGLCTTTVEEGGGPNTIVCAQWEKLGFPRTGIYDFT